MAHTDRDAVSEEKAYNGHNDNYADLQRIKTSNSIFMSPELFEKLYLTPEKSVKGDLRKTFGNPTPLALIGFVLSLTPLSEDLMAWRGAGGSGAAQVGGFYFIGGVLMILGGLLEFFLGNTFPFVVFSSFGGFWLAFGATLTPAFNAAQAYATATVTNGAATVGFNASFGFYLLSWGALVFLYLVCSLRTNVVFVVVFFALDLTFFLLVGAYWSLAEAKVHLATTLIKGAGGCAFVCCMAGWYILTVQLFASVDFPLTLPVGDLSTMLTGATEKAKRKGDSAQA